MDIAPFKHLMLNVCGFSLENEREQTLISGLRRRMSSLGIDAPDDYHALLLRGGEEMHQLVELLTVNETYFFREPEHLRLAADKLLPEFMAKRKDRPVRILSAGCSTGEEPYSIAIMLRERYGADSERLFTVIGVDIDASAIANAKKGVYGKGSFRGMGRALLERYFESVGQGEYQVLDSIKRQVGFEVVNLLGSSYPQGMQLPDIIFYRNVSIYFPQKVQQEIFGRLAGLLHEGGCLMVGATETIHHDIGILSLVERDSLFFYRKTPAPVMEDRRATMRTTAMVGQSPAGNMPAGGKRPVAAGSDALRTPARPVPHKLTAGERPQERSRELPDPASISRDVRGRFDTALGLARDRRTDEALAVIDAVIEEDNSFVKAYTLKGSLLLSASRYDETRVACDAALTRDPLCLEACLMLGIVARHEGNQDEAFKRFREAIYLDASCWLAHFYTAEILFGQRDGKRARKSYEAAARILEKGSIQEHGQAFFPLSFNAEQFITICRHKLSLLT